MKAGFVTCVRLGLGCMEEIYAVGGELNLCITLEDDQAVTKSGRVWLDEFAGAHAIPLIKVRNVNDAVAVDAVREAGLDWLFIIGWSQIARQELLAAPRRGVLGMHPTLLPTGRGRASIPWAILKGLTETGVTLFKLDEGVDTGPVVAQERIPIDERETASTLYAKVEDAHRLLIRRVWPLLVRDEVVLTEQDDEAASEWPGRSPEDGEITPDMTVAEVDRLVRATTHPYPGAFWVGEQGKVVRVWTGRPAGRDDSNAVGALPLKAADGTYVATEYELE